VFSRRAALREILDWAVARGEIAPDEDLDILIDVVFGVLWYRLLLDHAPISERAGLELAALILRAIR
jgi:hypothetical protein